MYGKRDRVDGGITSGCRFSQGAEDRLKTSRLIIIPSSLGVHGGTIPSVVGDEWNLASERRSIQPRVPLKAWEGFKQRQGPEARKE